ERSLEYAGRVSAAAFTALGRVAAAPPLGCRVRAIVLLLLAVCSLRATTYYVTVAGLGGTPEYESQFEKWAADLQTELKKNGASGEQNIMLRGSSATRAALEETLGAVAREARSDDQFALFLIGHGTFDG